MSWTIQDSRERYNLSGWCDGYFDVGDNGLVLSATVQVFINGPAPNFSLLAMGDGITMVLGTSNLPVNVHP